MADSTQFGHDHLGHLLSDQLLVVPTFQRRFAWQENHIEEFWTDIERARQSGASYFLGTIVLATSQDDPHRKLIIDGQQRITTTAILYTAIRDQLTNLGHERAASSIETTYLSNYVLVEEKSVAKLSLSTDDQPVYTALLDNCDVSADRGALASAYRQLRGYVNELSPTADDYKSLIDLSTYIDKEVQVLLAVATGLAEAYVIFETLNDRGADLTTADLLKNYLFSQAGKDGIAHAQAAWTRLSGAFEKPDDFLKFLRYEYMSRKGHVTNRRLYKALQTDIQQAPQGVRQYLIRSEETLSKYRALKEPDDQSWSSQNIEVRDSLLAFRRFGFESNMPLLIAVFAEWDHTSASKAVDIIAAWSFRAWVAGTIGGGVAEKAFCSAAQAVSSGEASSVEQIREYMLDLVPDDAEFRQAFMSHGRITTTRAKYVLAMLERQHLCETSKQTDALPDWSSKTVTIEHILPKSSKEADFDSGDDYEAFTRNCDRLQNLTLLERSINGNLDNKSVSEKLEQYEDSAFALTRLVGNNSVWDSDAARKREEFLADLAVRAWPR